MQICFKIFSFLCIILPINMYSQNIEYLFEDGIYIEKPKDTSNTNRYTEDNIIYQPDDVFYYTYEYLDSLYNCWFFNISNFNGALESIKWELVTAENISDSTITGYKMKVHFGLSQFATLLPDYDQTVVEYILSTPKEDLWRVKSFTGVIENPKNVWIHPPRQHFFKILELGPFPFIQAPYELGNRWNWELEIGDIWSDPFWAVWEGSIRNRCIYEITDTNFILQTSLGDLKCFVIESTCKNEIGETFLKSYFNPDLGFVKLEYINIDKSRITIELEKVEK